MLAGAEEVVNGGAEPVELVRDGQVPPLQPVRVCARKPMRVAWYVHCVASRAFNVWHQERNFQSKRTQEWAQNQTLQALLGLDLDRWF